MITEHGFTLGTPDEERARFDGDRVLALKFGRDRAWTDIEGNRRPYDWSTFDLIESTGHPGRRAVGLAGPGRQRRAVDRPGLAARHEPGARGRDALAGLARDRRAAGGGERPAGRLSPLLGVRLELTRWPRDAGRRVAFPADDTLADRLRRLPLRHRRHAAASRLDDPRCRRGVDGVKAHGKAVRAVTNNSRMAHHAVAERFRRYGLPLEDDEVFSALSATAQFIAHEHPGATVYPFGADGMIYELRAGRPRRSPTRSAPTTSWPATSRRSTLRR